ncbi:MAG: hypothetical protein KJO52_04950, partial [Maribacter sp.]|nr:hypothetical protein [Maribacter sp.]
MNDSNKSLFSEFNPVTKQEWMEKVNIDLKGADFDKKLVWKNLSKIKIQPFYNAEDKQNYIKNTGKNSQSLINYRSIIVSTEEKANQLAVKAIEEGINGLLFTVDKNNAVAKLLKGIDLNEIVVSFCIKSDVVKFASDFFGYAEKNTIPAENLKGYLDTELIT